MARNFRELLEERWDSGARICVGLDPVLEKLPQSVLQFEEPISYFLSRIVVATADTALCYKPNIAFFARYGTRGLRQLHGTLSCIRSMAPHVPVILDGKRGDIGATNHGYVAEAFEDYRADALTVSPYLGAEALGPLLEQKDKGIFVLCKTSNKGSAEFQDLSVEMTDESFNEIAQAFPADHDGTVVMRHMPLYQYVAYRVGLWNRAHRNCGLVVGATYPAQLKLVRESAPFPWILVPGVGAQGGDLEAVVRNGLDRQRKGLIVNASSSILYASSERDFPEAAYCELEKLTKAFNAVAFPPGSFVDTRV